MSDEAVLSSFQLADSFLPVGSYSCSYGLEQFVQSDRVADKDDLRALVATYLRHLLGPGELVALRAAYEAAGEGDVDALVEADERLHAMNLPAEFRESATRSGARLCDLRRETDGWQLLSEYITHDPPQQYPVVLGAVAAFDGIEQRRACLMHCYSFCSELLGAAQRLLSLGHTEAQNLLSDIRPVVVEAVDTSAGRSLDEMEPFAPLVEVQAADHERAERRLFVS